jgi:1,4-alpha-glucan branching enzyme
MIKVRIGQGDAVKVTFALPAGAPAASVVGNFNAWDPLADPMRKRSNGTRSAVVEVPRGSTLQFRYLLDGGEWTSEDEVPNDAGPFGVDSVLEV